MRDCGARRLVGVAPAIVQVLPLFLRAVAPSHNRGPFQFICIANLELFRRGLAVLQPLARFLFGMNRAFVPTQRR